jgi:hypothetical protein
MEFFPAPGPLKKKEEKNKINVSRGTFSIKLNNGISDVSGNVYNIENVIKQQRGNLLMYLISALCEVVPPDNVIRFADNVMRREYKSENREKHLQTLKDYLYDKPNHSFIPIHFNTYISEAIEQFNINKNFVLDSPTGSGKSKLIDTLCTRARLKVLITHVTQLCETKKGVVSLCYGTSIGFIYRLFIEQFR